MQTGLLELIVLLFYAALILPIVAGMWAVFAKAGQPGWAALVPIYNIYVMCTIAGKPGWWTLLCLIPCANIIVFFLVCLGIAKAFGRDIGTAIGLYLLGFVFWPILGFGSAQYKGA